MRGKKKSKKPRTSKVVMWLFIVLFIYVIIKGVNYDFSKLTYIDTAIFVACITAVAGITGAIVTHYLNNSNAENLPRIQTELLRDSADVRLYYNEAMMKLQKKYNMTDEDVYKIESTSNTDEFMNSVDEQGINELNADSVKAHEDVTVQNY